MKTVRVGYQLWGTVEFGIPDDKEVTQELVEELMMDASAAQLLNGVEGLPFDVDGVAIDIVSIEEASDGDNAKLLWRVPPDIVQYLDVISEAYGIYQAATNTGDLLEAADEMANVLEALLDIYLPKTEVGVGA